MTHVNEVKWIDACRFESASGPKLLVQSLGEVLTSHWSDIRLAPRYAAEDPPAGLMEFDFRARAPSGRVLDCSLKVTASIVVACPAWLEGVKIYSATNSETLARVRTGEELGTTNLPTTTAAESSFGEQPLAVYEDHFHTRGHGPRRRLRHQLALHIEGPDGRRIVQCMEDVASSRVAAAVAAAYSCGGEALSVAIGELMVWLRGDLGSGYAIRFDDRARWVGAEEGQAG
ncbi:hypothetical protein [Variovorax sp. YR752]|uniref:hypothetical protein n=1 Tax=Variovorax sp. YR752 TaxID=1884383 RepID=UPI0031378293